MVGLIEVAAQAREFTPVWNDLTCKWTVFRHVRDVHSTSRLEYGSRLTAEYVCDILNLRLILDTLMCYTQDNEDGVSADYAFYDTVEHICSAIDDQFKGMKNETEIIRSVRANC